MTIYVFYADDYPENGGIGLSDFSGRALAAEFITGRMKMAAVPDLKNYRVFEGREIKASAVEVATRIEIE